MVAILAIYIPILREEVYSYVKIWNSHRIRPQKGRPNIVTGKPYMLYHNPKSPIVDYGSPYNADFLQSLKEEMPSWDVSAYLPEETLAWCTAQMRQIGFDPFTAQLERIQDRSNPFRDEYIQLRNRAQSHISSGASPALELLPHPVGNWNFTVRFPFV